MIRDRAVNRRWLVAGALVVLGLLALAVLGRGRDSEPAAAPASASLTFSSAKKPAARAIVWAVGDGADGGSASRALARRIERDRPQRLLYLGDVYDRGTEEDFRDNYDTVYGRMSSITAPTPGNHEWGNRAEGYNPYWAKRAGGPVPPWYAFRMGGWRLISLNSEAPHDGRSRQLRWLKSQLKRRPGNCTLAFWHRPFQSAGRHGDQEDMRPVWDALRGRAALALSGHDHDSQRLKPRDGITQFVAGAGGRSLYPVNGADSRLAFADHESYAALRVILRPNVARLSFVTADATVLDSSTVRCDSE